LCIRVRTKRIFFNLGGLCLLDTDFLRSLRLVLLLALGGGLLAFKAATLRLDSVGRLTSIDTLPINTGQNTVPTIPRVRFVWQLL
jgi:hypothetical protein